MRMWKVNWTCLITPLYDWPGNEPHRGEDDELGGLTMMTKGLKNMDMVLFVTTLMLKHPDDYNVNLMAWNKVRMK